MLSPHPRISAFWAEELKIPNMDLNSCTSCWNNTAVTLTRIWLVPNRNISFCAGSHLWSTWEFVRGWRCWRSDRPHTQVWSPPERGPSAGLICGCCCRTWGLTASFRSHAAPVQTLSLREKNIFLERQSSHSLNKFDTVRYIYEVKGSFTAQGWLSCPALVPTSLNSQDTTF